MLTFIFIGYFSIEKKQNTPISAAIEAIPIDVGLILECRSLKDLNKEILNSGILSEISELTDSNSLLRKTAYLETFLDNNNLSFLKHKKFFFALLNQANKYNFLISATLSQKEADKTIRNIILAENQKNKISTKIYDSVEIRNIAGKYAFAYFDNTFVFSDNPYVIEKSIRQKHSNNYITSDFGFKQVNDNLDNSNFKLWINFNNFSSLIAPLLKYKIKAQKIENFSNWLGANLNLSENKTIITGFIYNENTFKKYLSVFSHVTPHKFSAYHLIPVKTSEFYVITFENFSNLLFNYEKYASQIGILSSIQEKNKNFKNNYGIDPVETYIKSFGNFIAFLKIYYNREKNTPSNFIIIHIKNKDQIINDLNKITNRYCKANNLETSSFSTTVSIENIDFEIKKLPVENFFDFYLYKLYRFPKQKFYVFLNDYLIITDDYKHLKIFLKDIITKKTLNFDENFIAETEDLYKNTPNIIYFQNIRTGKFEFQDLFTQKTQKKLRNFSTVLRKSGFFFLTIAEEKSLFRFNLLLPYYPDQPATLLTTWETELKADIKTKPLLLLNHNNGNRDIFVQDARRIAYLIDYKGDILWSALLKEPIRGKIYQIDLFHNGKRQIIFSLKNYLIVLDRNGKTVENFPVKYPAPTDKGVFVFLYDGKKYRFFVPLTNNKIAVYDEKGKPVEGWKFAGTPAPLHTPVKHFYYKGKDYIVFADDLKLYILNRKGEVRIVPSETINTADNSDIFFQPQTSTEKACFIINDVVGNVKKIYLTGKVETLNLRELSKEHFFKAADLDNDTLLDYIFIDQNTLFVYNHFGNKIFTYNFPDKITKPPVIFKFSKNDIRIGITDETNSKIYLFTSNGTLSEYFPLEGNTPFSIGVLKKGNKFFNLVVGNKNFLYNYNLE